MKLVVNIFRKVLLPVMLLLAAVAAYIYLLESMMVYKYPEAAKSVNQWVFAVFTCIAAYLLQQLAGGFFEWYDENIVSKTATKLDDEFLPLFRKMLNVIIWALAILIILSRFGINTNGLIAALGVSSLAIALAAQDTISNIISGFLLLVDRPFRLNDHIKLPSGEKVTVLHVGLRRSRFLAEDGAIIIVPNLDLSRSKIVNYSYGEKEDR